MIYYIQIGWFLCEVVILLFYGVQGNAFHDEIVFISVLFIRRYKFTFLGIILSVKVKLHVIFINHVLTLKIMITENFAAQNDCHKE